MSTFGLWRNKHCNRNAVSSIIQNIVVLPLEGAKKLYFTDKQDSLFLLKQVISVSWNGFLDLSHLNCNPKRFLEYYSSHLVLKHFLERVQLFSMDP